MLPYLLRFFFVFVHFASPTADASIPELCLLPIGDSITQAIKTHDSWRYPLWQKLVDLSFIDANLTAQFSISSAGSITSHAGAADRNHAEYRGLSFPARHESHSGMRADQILASLPGWLSRYDSDFHSTMCTPNCVLIHLGTNDVWGGEPDRSVVQEIRKILQLVRAKYNDAHLLVAMPIVSCTDRTSSLGISIKHAFDESGAKIYVVDLATNFDAMNMTYDGCHPNAVGEAWIAERWFSVVEEKCVPSLFVKRTTVQPEAASYTVNSAVRRSTIFDVMFLMIMLTLAITQIVFCS